MKIAVISDTHFGCRQDSQVFLDYFEKSLNEIFFPYLKENDIKTVIHLGDLVDRRKYINFVTAKRMRTMFLDRLEAEGIETHILLGNHDVSYKTTNEVNALNELVTGKYKHLHVYETATEITLGGCDILLLPWIDPSNYTQSMSLINSTKATVAMGHLEITGFEMHRGMYCDHGTSKEIFEKFETVLSGHFHHRSISDPIHYIGAFCEHNWSDFLGDRGFTVFDTTARQSTFVKNPLRKFFTIMYNDEDGSLNKILEEEDFAQYTDCYVKVICIKKSNPYMLDLLLDKLTALNPADVMVVEDAGEYSPDELEIIDQTQDTPTILSNYIDRLTINVNGDKLKKYILGVYTEALTISDKE